MMQPTKSNNTGLQPTTEPPPVPGRRTFAPLSQMLSERSASAGSSRKVSKVGTVISPPLVTMAPIKKRAASDLPSEALPKSSEEVFEEVFELEDGDLIDPIVVGAPLEAPPPKKRRTILDDGIVNLDPEAFEEEGQDELFEETADIIIESGDEEDTDSDYAVLRGMYDDPEGRPGFKLYRCFITGSHTRSEMMFEMYEAQKPLPDKDSPTSRRRTAYNIKRIKAVVKKTPKAGQTIDEFLKAHDMYSCSKIDLNKAIPPNSKKICYVISEGVVYYAVNWCRRVVCKRCDTEMVSPTSRAGTAPVFRPEASNFTPCCYKKAKYTEFKMKALTEEIRDVVTITYDIESYQYETFDGTKKHVFFCIAVKGHEGKKVYTQFEDFFQFVKREVNRLTSLAADVYEAKEVVELQLVSFNGSRYDDLLLANEWREFVLATYGVSAFEQIHYSERGRAISHNNLKIGSISIVWCDVLRFMPPTSLAAAAKDYKLDTAKGCFPFEVLNAYGAREEVLRDDDGFFSLSYYNGDAALRELTLQYYVETLKYHPKDRPNGDEDVRDLCYRYCLQDVVVTEQLYHHMDRMYTTYLTPCLTTIGPEDDVMKVAEEIGFKPMTMHSMSSLSARVMIHSALNNEQDVYDINGEKTSQLVQIYAPIEDTYGLERGAVYGGWVRGYYHGFLINKEPALKHMGEEWVRKLEKMCDAADVPLTDVDHVMGDIASMYPNGVTYPMPIGKGCMIYDEVSKIQLIDRMLECDNACLIPKFIARVKLTPPKKPCYFESTLPQRDPNSKSLCWTYRHDYAQVWGNYTSLDLWIACKGSKENDDDDTVWTIDEVNEIVFYQYSSPCYADFMRQCAKGKKDGNDTGNQSKRTCFKIVMNGGIGKLGQKIEGRMNVMGEEQALKTLTALGSKASLIGSQKVSYRKGYIAGYVNTEFALKTIDPSQNKWPQAHAAFMYAATRLMRLEWARLSRPPGPVLPIHYRRLPDPFYGDTDSKIQITQYFRNIPQKFIGDTVGVFNVEEGCSTQNIELEKVSNEKTDVIFSGILGPKCYFVASVDKAGGKQVLKFKCKGQTQYTHSKHACMLHKKISCDQCLCPHSLPIYTCIRCIIPFLYDDVIGEDDVIESEEEMRDRWTSGGYKYGRLRGISLLAFLRTLITGVSCATVSDTFDRTLSIGTSKLAPFSVSTTVTTRKLSKPRVVETIEFDVKKAKPFGPSMPDVVSLLDHGDLGVLMPEGDYLFK